MNLTLEKEGSRYYAWNRQRERYVGEVIVNSQKIEYIKVYEEFQGEGLSKQIIELLKKKIDTPITTTPVRSRRATKAFDECGFKASHANPAIKYYDPESEKN